MQHLRSGLLHAAWADDLLLKSLQNAPSEALGWHYADPEWPIGRVAHHIGTGVEWYKYVLSGVQWADVPVPRDHAGLEELRKHVASVHALFLAELEKADELITFEDEDGPRSVMRSTVLNQICHHSSEHRAQIFVALQINGYNKISADDFDVWAWEAATKKA